MDAQHLTSYPSSPEMPGCENRVTPAACLELYRTVLDTLPFPVWVKNTESRLLAVNAAFAGLFGASLPQELVGKTDFDILPADLAELYRADDRHVLATRQIKVIEEKVPDKGMEKWFETFKAPLINGENEVVGTIGFAREVTERKQGEKLRDEQMASLRLHHDALAAITQGVIITDVEGLISYANKGVEKITGYAQHEIIGRNCRFLQGAATCSKTVGKMRAALASRQQFHGEILNYRKDGSSFRNELSIVPIADNKGQVTQFVGILRDETASKLATEQLRTYAGEVEDLYQNAPCGYHSVNKDGVFIRINDTELRWLGYAREEVIGRALVEFLSPETVPSFLAYFSLLLEKQANAHTEVEFICKDGSALPAVISATALRDEAGNFLASRANVYDRREHKKAEAERLRQAAKLEAMSRHLVATQEEIRRRLSADLHDRTSPNLAAISINLGILANELAARGSSEITARIEDTRALIEDTAASIREVSSELRPPLLDYAGLLPAMESHLDDFTRRTGIEATISCENRELQPSPEHELVLFRIFQEALTNCAKHARATSAEIRLSSQTNSISMSISDNGIGFDSQHPSLAAPGSGLGLINMREATEFVGGTFVINSSLGKGTRIHVQI
ncbi:PAS domain S-box protein [Quatrionicoccus australiensis]|nr:PAS domain S-box protein [Quatrionicoccus australiensis]